MALANQQWPAGPGSMASRIRAHDWEATPLGPLAGWPQSLCTAVEIVLAMPTPATILWGPAHIQLYNDAYVAIARDRHPALLGCPVAEGWPEVYDHVVAPLLRDVGAGRSIRLTNYAVTLRDPAGRLKECVFDTDWLPLRDEAGSVAGALQTLVETTERSGAEMALRASEQRQAFLLTLSDGIRTLSDPVQIQGVACRLLGEHLGVQRAFYVAINEAEGLAVVERDVVRGSVPSLVGAYPITAFAWSVVILRRGECHVVADAQDSPVVPVADRPALAALGIRACMGAPIIKEGILAGALCVTVTEPRDWTEPEVELLRETAERIWSALARARAEAALRDSEARLKAAFAGVPAGLALIDVNGAAAIANDEYRRFLPSGVIPSRDPARVGRWRAWDSMGELITPQNYPGARALRGERIVPGQEMLHSDDEGRVTWTRVGIVPILDDAGQVTGALSVISDIDDLKRGADALRESEARFQQFANSSSNALWIRDAATLAMEYASPAIQMIYGISPEALLGDVRTWAALIVPEDRPLALDQLERARHGEAVVHEFRILRPNDGAFRWIRNTDFPLHDEHGRVQRIGGIAVDVTETRQAEIHRGVLMHELQHRVRNILAMTRSIAERTGDTAGDVTAYRDLLGGRLRALARVQVLLTQAANVGVDLLTVIGAEIDAQAEHEEQYSLSGPQITLPPKAAEVLTLGIHELATNALKYGAFSHAAGRVAVTWRVVYPADEPWLCLDWVETGAPAPLDPPRREGFGTILIQERIPYELQGLGRIVYRPEGWSCRLEFPLRQGDSILETDTVTPSPAIGGGCLDMTGETDLDGYRILVIEDDFFLASDSERALRRAGGSVLGPVAQARQALDLLARETPSCAVVDINLGHGAEFGVSEALQDAGVPFVFVTGYNDVVIPARFERVERLRKPVDLRQMVRVVSRMCEA